MIILLVKVKLVILLLPTTSDKTTSGKIMGSQFEERTLLLKQCNLLIVFKSFYVSLDDSNISVLCAIS